MLIPKRGISVGQLQDTKFPPKERILGPWLTEGSLTLLYAPRGIGKTFFALSCGHAIATGSDFLGWQCPRLRPVCLFDGEMGFESLHRRLNEIDDKAKTQVKGGMMHIASFESFGLKMPNLANPKHQELYTREAEGCDVVIIDNLLTCSAPMDHESDVEQWRVIQDWVIRMRQAGKAIVIIHHSGKNKDEQLGTSTKEAVMDTIIGMKEAEILSSAEGFAVELTFAKHRNFYGKDAKPMYLEYVDLGNQNQWFYKDLEDYRRLKAGHMMVEGLSELDVAQAMKLHPWQIRRFMARGGH